MKHQYFADITDYKKYSILRFLSQEEQNSLFIHWMLTPDDQSSDGRHITYLQDSDTWRKYEPDIFDSFTRHLNDKNRSLNVVEDESYLSNATFFNHSIPDEAGGREQAMKSAISLLNHDMVFLDPDNGMEVTSVSYGKKGSSKYVYWHELKSFFDAGSSVLLYQHFARVKREPYITSQVEKMKERIGTNTIVVFQTSWTAFFLLLQDKHLHFINGLEDFQNKWESEIVVHRF